MGVTHAAADPVASKQAEAAALETKITHLGNQEDALAEQYDAEQIAVHTATQRLKTAVHSLKVADAGEAKARNSLRANAVNAYMNGGSSPELASETRPLSSVNANLIRNVYVDDLAADQASALNKYKEAATQAADARTQLTVARAADEKKAQELSSDRKAVQATAAQMQGLLSQVKGQLAVLIKQQQAAQEAAAQKAAAEKAAEARAAVTSYSGSSSSPPAGNLSLGERVVQIAESRVGDPYVWGAAGPDAFDCSGLVMWAYAQVGISLPHYSGAQFDDGTQIPMSDLEPGDLVFPSDPGEHVAIYAGNGMIVQAPYTGADVQVVPLSSFFVLAVRIV